MTQSEAIWSAMLLGAIAIALFVVMRIRRRTDDYEQALTFKQRLPAWVHLCEKVIAYACILAIGAIVSWAFYKARSAIWPGRSIKGATAIFAVIGAASIAIPVGFSAPTARAGRRPLSDSRTSVRCRGWTCPSTD